MPKQAPKTKKKRGSEKAKSAIRQKTRKVKGTKTRKPRLSYFDNGFNGCW